MKPICVLPRAKFLYKHVFKYVYIDIRINLKFGTSAINRSLCGLKRKLIQNKRLRQQVTRSTY